MRISAIILALAAIAAMVGLGWLVVKYPEDVGKFADVKTLMASVGMAVVALVGYLGRIVVEEKGQIPPAPLPPAPSVRREPPEPLPAAPPKESDEYKSLHRIALQLQERLKRAEREQTNTEQSLARVRAEKAELAANVSAVSERLAALKYALLCGLVMCIASAIATWYAPADDATVLSSHVPVLAGAYAIVAFVFGAMAAKTPNPPNINLAVRIGLFGAAFVTICSLIINAPYTWQFLFDATSLEVPKFRGIPIGYIVVAARLILVPAVSVLACMLGTVGVRWFVHQA